MLLPPQCKRHGLGGIVELPTSAKMPVFFTPTVATDAVSIAKVGNTPIKHGIIVREGS